MTFSIYSNVSPNVIHVTVLVHDSLGGSFGNMYMSTLDFLVVAGDQPRLIQGIRRRDGIGEGQETTA